jgi:hypothetical protein
MLTAVAHKFEDAMRNASTVVISMKERTLNNTPWPAYTASAVAMQSLAWRKGHQAEHFYPMSSIAVGRTQLSVLNRSQ